MQLKTNRQVYCSYFKVFLLKTYFFRFQDPLRRFSYYYLPTEQKKWFSLDYFFFLPNRKTFWGITMFDEKNMMMAYLF